MKNKPEIPGFLSDKNSKIECTNMREIQAVLEWATNNGVKCDTSDINKEEEYPFYLCISGNGIEWHTDTDKPGDVYTFEEFENASKSVTMTDEITIEELQKRIAVAEDHGFGYFILPLLTAARMAVSEWIEESGMYFTTTKNSVANDKRVYLTVYF